MSSFSVVGINFRNNDTQVRSNYSLTPALQTQLYAKAQEEGQSSLILLSTCNRTELIGNGISSDQLLDYWQSVLKVDLDQLKKEVYIYKDKEAVRHIFRVVSGLDSQILGDYEIVGQFKQAFYSAKKNHGVDTFTEKLVNKVFTCSKAVKNNTKLSTGTTSVSYAAVQYLLTNKQIHTDTKALILGVGNIGKKVVENMITYSGLNQLYICNRSHNDTVKKLAQHAKVNVLEFNALKETLSTFDIVIVCTNAPEPIITTQNQIKQGSLFIDLSIPNNIDKALGQQKDIRLVDLDLISKAVQDTLVERKKYIPKAKEIIESHIEEFLLWKQERKQTQSIGKIKSFLDAVKIETTQKNATHLSDELNQQVEDKISDYIQKVISKIAKNIKSDKQEATHLAKTIQDLGEQLSTLNNNE